MSQSLVGSGSSTGGSYRLYAGYWSLGGPPGVVGVDDELPGDLPKTLAFGSPRPNPAQGSTSFSVSLPKAAKVSLVVYDLTGRAIATPFAENLKAGAHVITCDPTNWRFGSPPSGIFFARLVVDGQVVGTRKLALIR